MDIQLLEYTVMFHGNLVLDYTKRYTNQIAIVYDTIESIVDQWDQQLELLKLLQLIFPILLIYLGQFLF